MQEVLQLLKKHDICLNKKKSKFIQMKVMFLETIILWERLKMELEKIKVVRDWLMPKTVKEVQVFLRFANYYW